MAEQILASSELRELRLILLKLIHESEEQNAVHSGKLQAFRHVLEIIDRRLQKLGVTGVPEDWDTRR